MLTVGPVKINYGLFEHYGICDGAGFVIHNSKKHGMVVRESINDFSDGKEVLISHIPYSDHVLVVENAQRYLGASYALFTTNCEHFVRLCCGLEVESPQIQKYLIVGAGVTVMVNTTNKVASFSGLSVALAALITQPDKSPLKNSITVLAISLGIGLLLQ